MASNFTFLQPTWTSLQDDAGQTEKNAITAPRTCAFYARRTLERMVKWMYAHDSSLKMPYRDSLAAMIHEPTFQKALAPGLWNQVRMLHKLGNLAVHSEARINETDGLQATRCLHRLLGWLVNSYSKPAPTITAFDDTLVPHPRAKSSPDKTAEQLQALQDSLKQKDDAFDQSQRQLAVTQEEVDRLRAEIQAIKAANQQTVAAADYSEAETRDLFIDLMLREAAWDPHGPNVAEYPVTGMPNAPGVGYVDYVLWGDDGLPLAIVEAKRTKVSPQAGQRQAELYADCLERMTGQRPIIYYTNGYETWMWDDTFYPPRQVQGFATKDELRWMVNRRAARGNLTTAPINRSIVNRYYHEEAVRRVMEVFGVDRARAALLVMATGSGKTRLSIATVEILMKQNWVRRALFLADRTALLTQAKRAFAACLPNVSAVNLIEERESDTTRLVFSTYPTMMNAIDDARRDGRKRFGPGHFDLVIIDEAHRSIYQKYGAIFDYYDSLLLGLTATPKAEVDRNTYHLFDLEDHVPTYAYELEKAVADGYLVPPRVVAVPLKFQREGIKYDELSEEDQEQYERTDWGDCAEDAAEGEISAGAINSWLFNEDTVDKVLLHLMEHGQKIQGGDKLGKTIIFAANHDHAEFIAERFNKNYPHLAGKFLRVIDNQVKYAQTLIDDFYVADKNPFIAVSVDMLDTGIDVHEIVNLVFFKLVRSRTKFWQMIGRGTRLCPNLFGPGQDKQFFYVFDYCQNFEFFSQNPDGYEAPVQESLKQRIFKRRLALTAHLGGEQLGAGGEAIQVLRADLLGQMHAEVSRMDPECFQVRAKCRLVEEFSPRERWDRLTASDRADIADHLTALPTPDDDDEFARRFDLLVLNLQLTILENDPMQAEYQQRVRDLAAGLEEKRAIPSVAAQLELVQEIQTDAYWEGVTLPMLEQARCKLRCLIQFIDQQGNRSRVYTDFVDEIGDGVELLGVVRSDPNLENYRRKVERFIREHENHVTIHRLKHNQPIQAGDIDSLEAMLFADDGPGSREDFIAAYGTEQPLGKLVRQIVGLDRNAAKEAFAEFLGQGTLSADQITFINQIIDHIVQNGLMDPAELFGPPFTDMHDQGVVGVFRDEAPVVVG